MKRTGKYISVCLCAVMIASMFMCGGCQKQEKTKITKKKQIELWHYWDIPGNQQHLEELVDQFNQSQDKIEVKVSYIPDEDFKKQLALSMSEEKMPDIALVDSSDFQFLHQMKPFADLTDEIPELQEYSEKALAPCSADGRIYGQPFGVNCTAMFYNKKILEKAGCKVPGNWEEFEEIAAKVSDKTIKGFAITALQTEESMYEFLPILWSMGGDIHRINTASGQQAFLFEKYGTGRKLKSAEYFPNDGRSDESVYKGQDCNDVQFFYGNRQHPRRQSGSRIWSGSNSMWRQSGDSCRRRDSGGGK